MTRTRSRARGFTLVELTIALVLMAGMAAVLFGSLSLAARSWDGGEAKVQQVSDMRATQTYLRAQLSAQYPQRLWKAVELPLLFAGEHNEIRYAAILPARVAEGGVYYFRLAVVRNGEKSQLVQERTVPDLSATQEPEFRDAERSVLATLSEGLPSLAGREDYVRVALAPRPDGSVVATPVAGGSGDIVGFVRHARSIHC